MKRVFRFKKDERYDGDSSMDSFLFEYLTKEKPAGDMDEIKDNFKVTILIEKIPKYKMSKSYKRKTSSRRIRR